MSINDSYNEEAIVEAIAVALDNFYTNLIKKVDSLNIKAVMKRKNPYLFRAKAMNGAAQIIDAILAAFVSSSEETIFGNVFFEPIATAAAQGQKALPHSNSRFVALLLSPPLWVWIFQQVRLLCNLFQPLLFFLG